MYTYVSKREHKQCSTAKNAMSRHDGRMTFLNLVFWSKLYRVHSESFRRYQIDFKLQQIFISLSTIVRDFIEDLLRDEDDGFLLREHLIFSCLQTYTFSGSE